MTTEPIAALLSGEPQPPSRADDAAQDQLSPLDAVAEAPGLKLFKKGSGGGKVWMNMGASAKFHAVERKLSEIDIEQEAPQGGGRRSRSPEQRAAGRLRLHEQLHTAHDEHLARYDGKAGRPCAERAIANRCAKACACLCPRVAVRVWLGRPAFMSAQMCTAPLMPAQTSRNHSTLHEVDAWLGVEDFDEQMEKGTPYDAIGLLMKPLWSVLDAAADLGPRSADVSTNCGRIQWARCFITN